jgi:N-acetyl-anhydromuramyl-L-alanine amidase AmpD
MSGDGFPDVIWIPANPQRYFKMASRTIDAIVLHSTDGTAIDAQQTARNVFASPPEIGSDGKPRQQSSHYIVGRDGTVVQCVRHKDVAYHVNAENPTTIGIEHNARSPQDTTLTDIQYWKSAQLVRWLCKTVGIPMDPWYIWGHSQIDPGTTHSSCPQRALNWDTYWQALNDAQAVEQGRTPMRLWDQ